MSEKRGPGSLLEWLGILPAPRWLASRPLGPFFSFVVALLLLMALANAFRMLGKGLFGEDVATPLGGLGLGALIVALFGAPFLIWRSIVAQQTVDIAKQSHITEQINTAVQGLGAVKVSKKLFETPRYRKDDSGEWQRGPDGNPIPAQRPDGQHIVDRESLEFTEPNLEVRIGAIYALERIARTSLDDHIQIMEILTAYIRENAKASDAPPANLPGFPENFGGATKGWPEVFEKWQVKHLEAVARLITERPIRADIQVALTVIGRRGDEQVSRELEGTRRFGEEVWSAAPYPSPSDVTGVNEWNMAHYRFRDALEKWRARSPRYRLDLRNTNLRGADLTGGRFDRADFRAAQLQGAKLDDAYMQGAKLDDADMQGASFRKAQMQGCDLFMAQVQGASFVSAQMQGANIVRTRVQGADLGDASLAGAHTRMVDWTTVDLTAEQVVSTNGDGSVVLPAGVKPGHPGWPLHWSENHLALPDYSKKSSKPLSTLAKVPPTPDDPA